MNKKATAFSMSFTKARSLALVPLSLLGNACYAGYRNHGSRGLHKKSVNENFDSIKTGPFLFPRPISAGRMEDRRRNSVFS